MGDDAVALALVTEVLTRLARPRDLLRGGARQVHRGDARLVGRGDAGPGAGHLSASTARCCSLTLSFSPMTGPEGAHTAHPGPTGTEPEDVPHPNPGPLTTHQ